MAKHLHNFLDQVERDDVRAVYAKAYAQVSDVLSRVMRLGILGFDHCVSNKSKVDKYVADSLLSLARDSITKFDSICCLLAVGAVESCHPLLRSVFESTLGIRYIAADQSAERAMAYRFAYMKGMIKKYKQWSPSHPEYAKLQADMANDLHCTDLLTTYASEAPKLVVDYETYLASSRFATVATEWDRLGNPKSKKGQRDKIEWYSLFSGGKSINSLADLASEVQLRAGYESLWRFWTGSTHALDTAARLYESPNLLRPLRSPEGITSAIATGIVMFTCGIESLVGYFDPAFSVEWNEYLQEQIQPKIDAVARMTKEMFDSPKPSD